MHAYLRDFQKTDWCVSGHPCSCKGSILKVRVRVYSDGASRGNPGISAIAFMIVTEDDRLLKRYSKYVGIRTNNQAEYEALISALESASELTDQEVTCFLDSELVVKHINGEYQIRNPRLKTLWLKVQELKQKFQKTTFKSVPRTDTNIKQVDRLANQALDRVKNNL
jgi:ribonuclease HI